MTVGDCTGHDNSHHALQTSQNCITTALTSGERIRNYQNPREDYMHEVLSIDNMKSRGYNITTCKHGKKYFLTFFTSQH